MANQTNKKLNNTTKNVTQKKATKDTKENIKIETQKIDNLGILIQLVLSIVLIIFIVYSIFITEFYNLTVGLLTALAFTMAYNNHTTYQRKNFTIIYLVIGIAGIAFLIGTLF